MHESKVCSQVNMKAKSVETGIRSRSCIAKGLLEINSKSKCESCYHTNKPLNNMMELIILHVMSKTSTGLPLALVQKLTVASPLLSLHDRGFVS